MKLSVARIDASAPYPLQHMKSDRRPCFARSTTVVGSSGRTGSKAHLGRGALLLMELDVGIACGACDTLNSLRAGVCLDCGHDLTYFGAPPPERVESSGSVVSETGFSSRSDNEQPSHPPQRILEEEVMEQARNYVCKECSTAVPSGHKFCGTCGAAVPIEVVELRIKYFGAMQAPGKARL